MKSRNSMLLFGMVPETITLGLTGVAISPAVSGHFKRGALTKKLITFCVVVATTFTIGLPLANADVLTFDDIITGVTSGTVPNGYGGFDWDQFGVLHRDYHPGSGYENGTVSGDYVAYNQWADVATISDGTFWFLGAYLTSAWDESLSIKVDGYLGSSLMFERTVTVVNTGPTWFDFNYSDVDSVKFTSLAGGNHFAMDNFTFSFGPLDDLRITPTEGFNSSGDEGGPFIPDCCEYTLTNIGPILLDWTATATQPWLDVTPGSGTLAGGASTKVDVCINTNANTLPPGDYNDVVTFTNTNIGHAQTRAATLEVIPVPGEIEVTDSIPPVDDLNMPFGKVVIGVSRTEQITIANTDPNFSLVVTDIGPSFEGFYDEFPSTTLNPENWTGTSGVPTIDDVGLSEPSPPYSLRLDSSDAVESRVLDLSGLSGVQLTYWYEQTGGGESPDDGDDLIFEYWNASNWVELERQLGSSPDMTSYAQSTVALPPEAMHAGFRLRIRSDGDAGYDDWFVDDVAITMSNAGGEAQLVQVFRLENVPDLPVVIPPSDSNTFDVIFTPTDVNNYEAMLVIKSTDEDEPVVELQLTGTGVPEPLQIKPDANVAVEFAGHPNGPFMPTYADYNLTNIGSFNIDWTAEPNCLWLDIEPNNGTLKPGESTSVTVQPNSLADKMPEGYHYDDVYFTDVNTTKVQTRKVCLHVYTGAKIWINPLSFDVNAWQGHAQTEIFTIGNSGDAPLTYTLSSEYTWLEFDPNAGTVPPGDVNEVNVIFIADVNLGTYKCKITIDSNDRHRGRINIQATMTVEPVDYFTELFDLGDPFHPFSLPGPNDPLGTKALLDANDPNYNDMSNRTLTFRPDGSCSYYALCSNPATAFPVDANGRTIVSLGDDDYIAVPLLHGAHINFYGESYDTFYIGSNGYITFRSGDYRHSENLTDHFDLPRIAGLFDDLDPSADGTISYKQLYDRVVVTFENVPEFSSSRLSSFQIEMRFNGKLRITWLNIDAPDGLIGLSDGYGLSPYFRESDLSEYDLCNFPADLNGDIDVDFADFDIFAAYWRNHYDPGGNWVVRDEFNTVSYSGNDGTQNWTNDWQESGESDGPSRGLLRVVANRMRIGHTDEEAHQPTRRLTREANLSGATSATLTYDYQAVNHDDDGSVRVQVSGNGGLNWNTLATYRYNAGSGSASFDITPYISSNTQISFKLRSEIAMYLYVDNVQIEYSREPRPWNGVCDFNDDLRIDFKDLRVFVEHWLE